MIESTKNQQQVIDQKNSNILVSASAGSGKTTTMIGRVLRIIDDGISIDRLVIITFTKASAADMRDKLEKRLLEAAKKATGDKKQFIEKQIVKLPSANISTIDSFAQTIVEQYYDVIGIDPKFRIIEGGENELLKEEIFDLTVNYFYQKEDQSFIRLIKNFGNLNNLNQFKKTIYALSDFVRARFDGVEWLNNLPNQYSQEQLDVFFDQTIRIEIDNLLKTSVEKLDQAIQLLQGSDAKKVEIYQEKITQQKNLLASIKTDSRQIANQSFLEVTSGLNNEFSLVNLRPKDEELIETKALSKKVRDDFNQFQSNYFQLSSKNIEFVHSQTQKLVETLVNFTNQYLDNLEKRKTDDRVLDFADIELKAHQILQEEEVANDLKNRFFEVLVDEYQDVNRLQDEIVSLITNDKNRFMVGDIKQSIYGFRQASPDLFVDYFNKYQNSQDGTMISLSENFRSGSGVLLAINQIFRQIMSAEFGGIDYKDSAELVPGLLKVNKDKKANVQLKIIHEKDQIENSEEFVEKANETKDDVISKSQVKELIKTINELTNRGVNYSQIAILTRTKAPFEQIISEFNDVDIPVVSTAPTKSYFNRFEISVLVSFLQIIDNPLIDIPLIAVLRSPLFNVSANELVELVQQKNQSNLYYFDLVNLYLQRGLNTELNDKLERFVKLLEKYQQLANQNLISDLIFEIYKDTGWIEYVAGLKDGIQRQANLQAFYQYSQSFQETNFIGLHYFMNYIDLLTDAKEDLESAKVASVTSAVQLMTIHGSKGLEFNTVIMINLDSGFNTQDLTAPILLDGKLGAGLNFVNPISNVRVDTWPRLQIKRKLMINIIAEQMRLLYVALTRAEENLILIGTKKDSGSKQFNLESYSSEIESLNISNEDFLPVELVSGFNNFLDMILYALMSAQNKNEDLLVDIQEINPDESDNSKISKEIDDKNDFIDADDLEEIKQLAYLNLNNQLSITPAFYSVSELKRINEDPDNFELNQNSSASKIVELPAPHFFVQEDTIAANKIGSAVHSILEQVDYKDDINQFKIDEIIQRSIESNIFNQKTADAIDEKNLLNFFETDFAKELAEHADTLKREESFAMLVPSNQLTKTKSDKPVLVKGTIDGYYLNQSDKSITVFDYKTNSIKNGVDQIIERYADQISWYSKALESMHPGYTVKNKILVILSDTKNPIHYL